jgi:hypothetical protein
MARYILVPGACHGGWWYQPVVDALRAAGHGADAITLSGLDPDGPPAPAGLGTLMQRSKLTGAYKAIGRKHYVAATGADWLPPSPFTGIADSLRRDPAWTVTALDSGHNLLANGPQDLVTIMLGLAG